MSKTLIIGYLALDGRDDAWAASVLDDSHFLSCLLSWNCSMSSAFEGALLSVLEPSLTSSLVNDT